MKFLIIALIFCNALYSQNNAEIYTDIITVNNNEWIGKTYPNFKFQTSSNTYFTNKNVLNKITVINFWAQFCTPCMAEMPTINEFYLKYKNDTNFVFLSFSTDDTLTIMKVIKRFNIPYKINSINKGELMRLNLNNGLPTIIMLNRNAEINNIIFGGNSNENLAREIFFNEVETEFIKLLKKH